MNGNNPTLLYGYGGFSISLTPVFRISSVMFLQNFGGVYAVANLRGGAYVMTTYFSIYSINEILALY